MHLATSSPIVTTDQCLLLFDIHQDIDWVGRILKAEQGRFTHLLLGGDYFDRSGVSRNVLGIRETCDFLCDLRAQFEDQLTLLLGNHDVAYLDVKPIMDGTQERSVMRYPCSGFTAEKANVVARFLDWDFWQHSHLFRMVNGFLVSHAGIAGRYWDQELEPLAAVRKLDRECRSALKEIHESYSPIMGCGRPRGGEEEIGGLVWQDFNFEFADELPLPQIFGHTPSATGARQKGSSWCLDGAQTCYGILDREGKLEVRDAPR